jgi:hypothetical protein
MEVMQLAPPMVPACAAGATRAVRIAIGLGECAAQQPSH